MIQIGYTQYNCELADILDELAYQLKINGIELLQKRKNLPEYIQVQCPFHSDGREKNPSAGIRKKDGLFHCFACNTVRLLPEVISYCFGKDDILGKFGTRWLMKNFHHLDIEHRAGIALDMSRDIKAKPIQYVSEEELDSYRYYHPYWKERGIVDDYIIELFDLGYDKKTQCITFPVRDIQGNCLFVARRSVKHKQFYYPKGVEKPLYGIYELYQEGMPDEVIVCESMIDALTAWQYGKYAVALNGLGTELQMRQLSELPCRSLVLATDNDKAGLASRKRIRQHISDKIIAEYVFPEGIKDLNMLDLQGFQVLRKIL